MQLKVNGTPGGRHSWSKAVRGRLSQADKQQGEEEGRFKIQKWLRDLGCRLLGNPTQYRHALPNIHLLQQSWFWLHFICSGVWWHEVTPAPTFCRTSAIQLLTITIPDQIAYLELIKGVVKILKKKKAAYTNLWDEWSSSESLIPSPALHHKK